MKEVKEIRKFVLKTDLPGGFVKGDVDIVTTAEMNIYWVKKWHSLSL